MILFAIPVHLLLENILISRHLKRKIGQFQAQLNEKYNKKTLGY